MKNNRQVGLDGRIFVSTCMRRGTFFVFILMLYGILTAAADILKLTGASGVAMGSFTTTLLIYDFIASLMLVVVVFYAYFLECGADIPFLKEKPLVIFGFIRLGYYLLLAYYVCYHMLYCFVNRGAVPLTLGIFYAVFLCMILLLIMANCYVFNTITRNIIRRSYAKSFRRLATAGIVVQAALPVTYLLVRIFMKESIGDEYFTSAVCDLIRLLVCPLLLLSVWFLFLHAVEQVTDVYSEVDSALLNKCYQITYSTDVGGKARPGGATTASATILPAPPAAAALPKATVEKEVKALKPGIGTAAASVSAAVAASAAAKKISEEAKAEENADSARSESTAAPAEEAENKKKDTATKASDEIIADFAAEARKAVAKTAAEHNKTAQSAQPAQPVQQQPVQQQPVQPAAAPTQPVQSAQPAASKPIPVQEFDPFPSSNHPRRTQQPVQQPQQQQQRKPQQGQPQRPTNAKSANANNRPKQNPNGQRPNGQAQYPQNGAQRPQNTVRQQPQQQRPAANQPRGGQAAPRGGQNQQHGSNSHR